MAALGWLLNLGFAGGQGAPFTEWSDSGVGRSEGSFATAMQRNEGDFDEPVGRPEGSFDDGIDRCGI